MQVGEYLVNDQKKAGKKFQVRKAIKAIAVPRGYGSGAPRIKRDLRPGDGQESELNDVRLIREVGDADLKVFINTVQTKGPLPAPIAGNY